MGDRKAKAPSNRSKHAVDPSSRIINGMCQNSKCFGIVVTTESFKNAETKQGCASVGRKDGEKVGLMVVDWRMPKACIHLAIWHLRLSPTV